MKRTGGVGVEEVVKILPVASVAIQQLFVSKFKTVNRLSVPIKPEKDLNWLGP